MTSLASYHPKDPTLEFFDRLNDPSRWVVIENAPICIPHERAVFDAEGNEKPPIVVTDQDLGEIVQQLQEREQTYGVLPVMSIGHRVQNDPRFPETMQPPIVGYSRFHRVGQFGPAQIPCVLATLYYKKENWNEAKEYPFRSMDFYPGSKKVTGVALLKRDPFLPMGLVTYQGASQSAVGGMPASSSIRAAGGPMPQNMHAQAQGSGADEVPPGYDEWSRHLEYAMKTHPVMYKMACQYAQEPQQDPNQQVDPAASQPKVDQFGNPLPPDEDTNDPTAATGDDGVAGGVPGVPGTAPGQIPGMQPGAPGAQPGMQPGGMPQMPLPGEQYDLTPPGTHTAVGAGLGGLAGAGVGGLIGSALGNPAAGVMGGSAIGAGAGGLAGSQLQNDVAPATYQRNGHMAGQHQQQIPIAYQAALDGLRRQVAAIEHDRQREKQELQALRYEANVKDAELIVYQLATVDGVKGLGDAGTFNELVGVLAKLPKPSRDKYVAEIRTRWEKDPNVPYSMQGAPVGPMVQVRQEAQQVVPGQRRFTEKHLEAAQAYMADHPGCDWDAAEEYAYKKLAPVAA